ncbi:Glu/Leu/Phe/Val dehydrogenase dimerization domain-containing protein [Amycolatopsis sp. BJA-103]|uniref:Glu/Leu/Phe/Val dehydrogenase dimerization domain-containing protein n=1 Tax=Amycolatopsis sp. BJA-103 TaxID=1911175 RepID=UPI000C78C7BD|nr:Glu/Leu/Phe/Val dehydrogenase dimerization domain-containing protein [Amycolatopsis sp. BJA-103]AUI56883.1 amino acid dehydrogenase [Amycolatopsis sp. BJA-103]PNE13417.1 amino acid dehydrogenase [Amycolatopsis sp. BJA-103]
MSVQELVVRRGRRSGVTTMVAVHSRVLGPAVGGCRFKVYPELGDAIDDVLRLSAAMTRKCAVAGLDFGGGKSVVALERVPSPEQRRDILLDHADLIASLDGAYLAGPDVGTGPDDMLVLRERTPHAFCVPEEHGGTGSSSGPTAVGVLAALRAGAKTVFGETSMRGREVVISGYGSVGAHLADALVEEGAEVTVSDVDEQRLLAAAGLGLRRVAPDRVLGIEADVLIPAAVGGVFGPAAEVRAPLVVGPANNQLTDDAVADDLAARGVLWIPDFVASAGGVVYTLGREKEKLTHDEALTRVETLEETTRRILDAASANGTTPLAEANALAEARLTSGAEPRTPSPREPRTAA